VALVRQSGCWAAERPTGHPCRRHASDGAQRPADRSRRMPVLPRQLTPGNSANMVTTPIDYQKHIKTALAETNHTLRRRRWIVCQSMPSRAPRGVPVSGRGVAEVAHSPGVGHTHGSGHGAVGGAAKVAARPLGRPMRRQHQRKAKQGNSSRPDETRDETRGSRDEPHRLGQR